MSENMLVEVNGLSSRFINGDISSIGLDCANPISEEGTSNESQYLTSAIERAEKMGIEVHVVIQNTINNEGFSGDGAIFDFSTAVAQYCQSGPDSIIFVVSKDNPRAFDILKSGRAQKPYNSQSKDENLINKVKTELQNDGSSMQSDAGYAINLILDDVNTLENPVQEVPETPKPIPTVGTSNDENNINVLPILGTGVGFIGSVGITALGLSWNKKRREYNSALAGYTNEVNEVITNGDLSTYNTEEVLKRFNDNDATELRELSAQANAIFTELRERADSIKLELLQSRTFFRNPRAVKQSYAQLMHDIENAKDLQVTLSEETKRVDNLYSSLGVVLGNVSATNQSISDQIDKLKSESFNTSSLDQKLADMQLKVSRLEALQQANFIEKTHTLASEIQTEINEMIETLESIPSLREELIESEKALYDTTQELTADITATAEVFTKGKSEFHSNYNAEADEATTEVERLFTILKQKNGQLAATSDSKDVGVIFARQTTIQECEGLIEELKASIAEANDVNERWVKARDKYPEYTQDLNGSFEESETFVLSNNEDIEKDTANALLASKAKFDKVLTYHNSTEKPDYISIKKSIKDIQGELKEITDQANEEKREMDELRAKAVRMPKDIRSQIKETNNYISDNDQDIPSGVYDALNNVILAQQSGYSRGDLRDYVNYCTETIKQIREIESEAKNAVKRAEAERARIAAELARQRAAAERERAAKAARAAIERANRQNSSLTGGISRGNSGHTGGRIGGRKGHTGGRIGGRKGHTGGGF